MREVHDSAEYHAIEFPSTLWDVLFLETFLHARNQSLLPSAFFLYNEQPTHILSS